MGTYFEDILGEEYFAMESAAEKIRKNAADIIKFLMTVIDNFIEYLDKLPISIANKIEKINFRRSFYTTKGLETEFIEMHNACAEHLSNITSQIKVNFDALHSKDVDIKEREEVFKGIIKDINDNIKSYEEKLNKNHDNTNTVVPGNNVKAYFASIITEVTKTKNAMKQFKRNIKAMKLENFVRGEANGNLINIDNLKGCIRMINQAMMAVNTLAIFEIKTIFKLFKMRGPKSVEDAVNNLPNIDMNDIEAQESLIDIFEKELTCFEAWYEVGE